MEKEARSALERVTQKARRLLEHEFAEQLAGIFGIMQDGRVDEQASGNLDQRQQSQRTVLLAAIDHKRLSGMQPAQAVADCLRDAAFTTLNRFVALKMLERRSLIQESISKGDASSGFAEFTSFASGLRLPDGTGYRLYLESLFDELSTEIKVLFDRREPAGVLWPRKIAFDVLLSLLNACDLASVWDQDETIGWVYQYFNSGEERRAMRDNSQAPRDARELAVRNQFFTPNYVVRFLVHNTLGRIWYDMCQGNTGLGQKCEFLIKPSGEVIERTDQTINSAVLAETRSKDENLRSQPSQDKIRTKKDPRSIRVIDPACGSGHFLLGSFDLFITIYVEAWTDDAPPFEASGRTLREDYPTETSLRQAIPGLILRYNLHGVDIDPRCGQIAQLALWMRAQRAFADAGVSRDARPAIVRSNIVIAEPMPGGQDLFDAFRDSLKEDCLEALLRRALGLAQSETVLATKAMADSLANLIQAVWDGLKFAGEMGLLLQVEKHLSTAIERGRSEWDDKLPLFRVAEYRLGKTISKEERFAQEPIASNDFWGRAERVVHQALSEYVHVAGSTRRRLFADDAAQGFALADLAAKRFDVVLMNPPFGACTSTAKSKFESIYPKTKNDIYSAFVERGIELLLPDGRLGAITSRTGFFLSTFQRWREDILLQLTNPIVFADLGMGVLDGAMVETSAYILEKKP